MASRLEEIKRKMQAHQPTTDTSVENAATMRGNSGGSRVREIKRKMVTDVDAKYIQSFINDSQGYIRNTQQEYDGLTWQNATSEEVNAARAETSASMNERARKIRTFMDAYKDDISEEQHSALGKYLDDFSVFQNQSAASFRNARLFESEDEYNDHVNRQKQLTEDISLLDREISDLTSEYESLDWTDSAQRERMRELEDALSQKKEYRDRAEAIQTEHSALKEAADKEASRKLKYAGKTYSELQMLLSEMESGEDKEWLASYTQRNMTRDDLTKTLQSKKGELGNVMALKDEYDSLSRQLSVLTPSSAEAQKATNRQAEIYDQYGDLDARIEMLQDEIWRLEREKKYRFLSENDDYDKLSSQAITDNWGTNQWSDTPGAPSPKDLEHLTKDELANLRYISNKEGDEAGREYLEYLEYAINERKMNAFLNTVSNATQSVPVLSQSVASLLSTPLNLLGGIGLIDATGQKIARSISGDHRPIDYNRGSMALSKAASTIRATVSQNITDATGTIEFSEDHPILARVLNGKGLADVYQLGMSMQDSAAIAGLALISPGLAKAGTVMLGTSAGTQTMLDAAKRGVSDNQAILSGILAAGFETIFETYELDHLLGADTNLLKSLGNQALSEAVGESATEISNILADTFIMAENSDWKQNIVRYLAENPSWDYKKASQQAFIDAALQVAEAGFGGAISGGIMGAGVSAIKKISNTVKTKGIENTLSNIELQAKAPQIIAEAFRLDPDNVQAKRLQEQLDSGKKISGKDVRALAQQNVVAADTQTAAVRLQELGEVGDIGAISRATAKQAAEQRLTVAEKKIISQSKYAQQVAAELKKHREADLNTPDAHPVNAQRGKPTESDTADTDKNSAVETYNKASTGGQTIQLSTNKPVTLQEISSVKNGKVTFKTADGAVVDAQDVSFATKDEAMIYEAVAQLEGIIDAEAANGLAKHLLKLGEPMPKAYVQGVVQAYQYGYSGYSRDTVHGKNTFSSLLTDRQRNVAYGRGKKYREETDRRNEGKRAQAVAASSKRTTAPDGTRYKKVQFEGRIRKWDKKQQAEVAFMDFIASEFSGNTVHVYSSWVTANGDRIYRDSSGKVKTAPNGWYDSHGDIWIDLNAGNFGEGLVMNTFAHELYHHIESQSPEKAKKLAEFIVDELGLDSVEAAVAEQIKKAERAGYGAEYFMKQGMSHQAAENTVRDRAFSDFVADSLESMFTHGDVLGCLQRLKKSDRNIFDRIKAFVDKWVRKLRQFYRGNRTLSLEGHKVSQLENFEKLQQLFAEALVEAGENYDAAETQKNTAEGGETSVQYSIREDMTEQERYDDLKNRNITVYNDNKSSTYADEIASIEALPELAKSKAEKIIKPLAEKLGILGKATTTPDIEIAFLFTKNNGLSESLSKQLRYGGNYTDFAKTLMNLDKVLQSAVLIEIHGDKYAGTSRENRNLEAVYVLFSAFRDGKNIIPVQMEIKKSSDVGGRLYLVVAMTKIEASVLGRADGQSHALSLIPASKYSLADIFKKINPKDEHFLKYVPDNFLTDEQKRAKHNAITEDAKRIAQYSTRDTVGRQLTDAQQEYFQNSKVRDKNGNLQVMYHGTSNQGFTVFDTYGGKFGLFGKGSYFTDNPEVAQSYTEKGRGMAKGVYSVYLNIMNPLDMDANVNLQKWTEAFKNADLDETYLDEAVTNEDAFKALKECLQDEGYVRWEAEEIVTDLIVAMGYDGITHIGGGRYNKQDDTRHRVYIAFEAEQVKNVENRNPTSNPDIRLSTRDPAAVSNRSILADALESTAQNDFEKNKLQEYKDKIQQIEGQERKLQGLQRQIREMSFAKGPRDSTKLSALRTEAMKTGNRISILDSQLLRLEATKPLQELLKREKNKAYKRAADKYRAAAESKVAKVRAEKNAKIDQIKAENQAARERNVESRKRTEVRHKILRVVKELQRMLLREDKKHHVPDSMKKAVASALDLLELDTVNAAERIAKYDALIENAADQDVIDSLSFSRDRIREQGEKIGERLKELHSAYAEIMASEDPDISAGYDPVIDGNLRELAATVGETPFSKLSTEQLEDVYSMYKMVLTRIRDANKSFTADQNATISERSLAVIRQIKAIGGNHKYLLGSGKASAFAWNNLKPIYAIEKMGSPALKEAFWSLIEAEGGYAHDIKEAAEFSEKMRKEYGYDQWDMKKKYSFTSTSGIDFDLTLEQIMSLYAFSRREQALDHLRIGGFVFDNSIEMGAYTKDGKELKGYDPRKLLDHVIKYRVNTADAHQLSAEILDGIISVLDSRQMKFVEQMQGYLSDTMGAKGNEVSMAMYGIKLFKEKHYWPLKSSNSYMFQQNEIAGEVRIKSAGFTQKTKPRASNPIILQNFMDVWAGHVHDMSMYHSFALPIEDFNRIFNFTVPRKEGQDPSGVKMTIQNAYGREAVDYLRQMIVDLNGGARSDTREGMSKQLMGGFKKAAVAGSLSVAIQQPSALNRAKALVPDKYFLTLNPRLLSSGELWKECKTYAPVAVIKEMGKFDMDTGMGTINYIKAEKKGIIDVVDDVTGWLPAKADEWTWVQIWAAVKKETAAIHPELVAGSKAFLEAAGKRFTEVIVKTQVYDSTLSRSGFMRSKSGLLQMTTSFMAEPTTSINMIEHAVWQWKRGYRQASMKTCRAVLDSVIANAVLVSLIYALRDDDEDETFLEKYFGSLTAKVIDGINPLTYIPWVKDVWSIAQGFDVERSDMSLIADISEALTTFGKLCEKDTDTMNEKELSEHRRKITSAVFGLVDHAANIFGLPVRNVRREIMAGINTFKNAKNNKQYGIVTNARSFWTEVEESVRDTVPVLGWFNDSKSDMVYDALTARDTAQIQRMKNTYRDNDGNFNESAYRSAIRKGLRENDPRILKAAKLRINGDYATANKLLNQIAAEGRFSRSDISAAIKTQYDHLKDD